MMGPKEIPSRSDLVDYNYAVAGHAGTLCDPDGELFIKPCTQAEIDFYTAANESHEALADLMPLFMGTLMLNDATDIHSIDEQLPVVADHISPHMKEQIIQMAHEKGEVPREAPCDGVTWVKRGDKKITTDTAVVLENTAHGFKQPNIMDCKLGVRLWADDAPEQKKKRFDKISAETTHRELGFRIAGMRVYKGSDNSAELDEEDYRIYNKDYGRVEVNTGNILQSFRKFLFNKSAGISPEVARGVAEAFRRDLERVVEILENEETRMYSASLLFVFEGDGAALRAAIEESNSTIDNRTKKGTSPGRSTLRVDSGISMDEDGELILGTEEVDVEDVDDEPVLPRIYTLKLIDFAHAQFTPGLGPDENLLTGVRSLLRIWDELSK